jgi:hypothetical protein
MRRILSLALISGFAAPGLSRAAELLRFDFNDSAHLAAQAGSLPAGALIGPLVPSAAAGAADFRGGLIQVPAFRGPQGPFSIEARFRVRQYGPESSRFIADILNTATWDTGPSQGFAFRVGGSYLYPVLPRDRYGSDAEWAMAQEAWSHIDRGRLSVCFADFVLARGDVSDDWKQALTDRCIPLGAWTHMAAVWDGKDMRIYLDGLEATDSLRVDGAGKPARVDSVETAYVGARTVGDWDPRHFDGDIDFVKVEDRALTAEEIRGRYQDTFQPERRDSLCHGVAIPVFPEAGKACQGRIQMEVKIANHGACTDPHFLAGFLAGDRLEMELAKDPAFDSVAVRLTLAKLSFELGPDDLGALAGYTGSIYWRVRLIPAATQALAKRALAKESSAEARPEWSLARPLLLDLAAPSSSLRSQPRLVKAQAGLILPGPGEPALFDLSGRRVPTRFRRLPGGGGGGGRGESGTLWRLESALPEAGLLLAR